MKCIKPQIHEAQQITKRINTKNPTSNHVIVKQLKTMIETFRAPKGNKGT